MKKILSLVIMFFTVMFAMANPTDEYSCYFADQTVQVGSTVDLQLTINKINDIGTVVCYLEVPTGVTINSVKGVGATTFNPENNNKLVLGGCEGSTIVADVNVTVSSTLTPGSYDMKIKDYQLVETSLADHTGSEVTTTLTVQRAAVISSMDQANKIEVVPFTMPKGQTYDAANSDNNFAMTILGLSEANIKSLEFTLTLPEGIAPATNPDDEEVYLDPEVVASKRGSITPSIEKNDDGTYTFSYSGSSSKYISALSKLSDMFAINLTSSSTLSDGVYTAKMTDVTMTTSNDEYTGDYYFTIFVGTPAETDPVVYGHYTTDAQTVLKTASENFVGSVDMSASTIDGENPALEGILVYGPSNTSFVREGSTLSTICLPFELTSNDKVQYYTLKSFTKDLMTFEEATAVPANTPVIFKGSIAASAEGFVYADPEATDLTADAVGGLTLTGTYKNADVASGEGYYLSKDGKFYGDGATVAPFRAYFSGSVSGAKVIEVAIEDATGIHNITDQLSNEDIYNLQGIRLNKTQKGVNIVGGKKVYMNK